MSLKTIEKCRVKMMEAAQVFYSKDTESHEARVDFVSRCLRLRRRLWWTIGPKEDKAELRRILRDAIVLNWPSKEKKQDDGRQAQKEVRTQDQRG